MMPLDYLPYTLFDDEVPLPDMGFSFATFQYVLSGDWYVPFPVIKELRGGTPNDFWAVPPIDADDARGAVIGSRSGMLVPLHAQAKGRFGVDHKGLVRNDQPNPREVEVEWP